MKRLFLIVTLLIIGASFPAYGQAPVITQPYAVKSQNYSSTIAVTNTFQNVLVENTSSSRRGCTIQNIGTNVMYVYFGAIASALTSNSLKLTTGQSLNCVIGGIVLQDQVSITGTATEPFYASQQ